MMEPSSSKQVVLAISTTGSVREAERISKLLVENHLVACANVIPSVRSFYWWEGKVCQDAEALILMKTTTDKLEELKASLVRLHSYDVPELIVTSIVDGLDPYMNWVVEVTHPEGSA